RREEFGQRVNLGFCQLSLEAGHLAVFVLALGIANEVRQPLDGSARLRPDVREIGPFRTAKLRPARFAGLRVTTGAVLLVDRLWPGRHRLAQPAAGWNNDKNGEGK